MKKILMICGLLIPLIMNMRTSFAFGHDVAFDTTNNRFLLVYTNVPDDPSRRAVYGRLTDGSGETIGSDYQIVPFRLGVEDPVVAYDDLHGRFLVVWHQTDARPPAEEYGGESVFGQMVDADGSIFGSYFPISAARHNQVRPAMVNDPVNHRFLVVWADHRIDSNDYDIYGQFVSENGSLIGVNFIVHAAAGSQDHPNVIFDAANRRYLVTWGHWEGGSYRMRGQYLNLDGSFYGGVFNIGGPEIAEGRIAHDNTGRLLVVYSDPVSIYREDDVGTWYNYIISAQFVTSTGVASGSKISFIDPGSAPYNTAPSVSWNSVDGRFTVAWVHIERPASSPSSARSINYQFLNADGTFSGSIISIPNADEPTLIYNPATRNTLMAYRISCSSRFWEGDIRFGTLAAAVTATPVSCPAVPPVCGNGRVEEGEECDDGLTASGDGCSSTCRTERCGDRIIQLPREQCDDGNTTDGDGCSAACMVEPASPPMRSYSPTMRGAKPEIKPAVKLPPMRTK